MMTYEEWCSAMERRYDVMPPWYWQAHKRKLAYRDWKLRQLQWLDEQHAKQAKQGV